MNETVRHSTIEQLHALIDRQLDATDHARVTEHLRECARCRSLYESLATFDAAFKRMPLEKVSDSFTESVASALGLTPRSPLLLRLLQNGAYVLSLLIVLGVMVAIFAVTGVIPSAEGAGEGKPGVEILAKLGGALSSAGEQLVRWLGEFFPFTFSRGAFSVSLATVAVLVMLAIVDRGLGKRLAQRLR